MEIRLREVTIRELTEGYEDKGDNGVVGYGGKLDIRPPYQRNFIYKDKQRDAVITTVLRGFPLNVMYWADNGNDTYEVIDGQQRTMSVCQFVNNDFSYMFQNAGVNIFDNIAADIKERILDYKLLVYVCKGTDSEKLDWFRTINIAGEKLNEQELRNAVHCGAWLSDAKRHFSKQKCPAQQLAADYLNGSADRQDYLETALKWIAKGDIDGYMARHQQDPNANALWMYFNSVIEWVRATFPVYRKVMKGMDWGALYDRYHMQVLDTAAMEKEISELMQDSEIKNQRGIYLYVLDHKEQHLDLRTFDEKTRRKVYEQQKGICRLCGKPFAYELMEADHILPWVKGGRTTLDNCQMLCQECNRRKSGK